MDRFLLDNAAQYQALVKALGPVPGSQTNQTTAGTRTSDMVVSARIRPLLEEDATSGMPCAVFPRLAEPGVVDIHDLYNHPKGRPILKVRRIFYTSDLLFPCQLVIIARTCSPPITS